MNDLNQEDFSEMRQWWYGKNSVLEYVSRVDFNGNTSKIRLLIIGPFGPYASERNASYELLAWSTLPGTNGRYRAALARTEILVSNPRNLVGLLP